MKEQMTVYRLNEMVSSYNHELVIGKLNVQLCGNGDTLTMVFGDRVAQAMIDLGLRPPPEMNGYWVVVDW